MNCLSLECKSPFSFLTHLSASASVSQIELQHSHTHRFHILVHRSTGQRGVKSLLVSGLSEREREKNEPRGQRRRWGWRIDMSKTWCFASVCFTACLSDINESAHGAKHTSADKQGHFDEDVIWNSIICAWKNVASSVVSLSPYISVQFSNMTKAHYVL